METLYFLLVLLSSISTGIFHKCNAQLVDCLESDREALLQFRKGLQDPMNRLSSWQGINCCKWEGVSCDNSTGEVVELNLCNTYPSGSSTNKRYALGGEILPHLTRLKSLKHLDLSLNDFNGTQIPIFFQSLKNLKYLNLSDAGFGGMIPPHLGNMSSLEHLDISSNFAHLATNLDWVANLISKKHIALDFVYLSSLASDWVRVFNMLPHLREAHLSYCGLQGSIPVPTFVNFSSLAVLNLNTNFLNSTFPSWLVNLTSLEFLDLGFNKFHGRFPLDLSDLPNLKFLFLGGNYYLTTNCSQLLEGSWNKIQVLDLSTNNIHGEIPDSIGNLTTLTSLDFFSNLIHGEIPNSISKLCSLKFLDLSYNFLTGSLPGGATEHCLHKSIFPRLQELVLNDNQFIGELPYWLGELQNLTVIKLCSNGFYGSIPASLFALRDLTVLRLCNNKLNGTLPNTLGLMSQLTILDISSNELTGVISETHFSNLFNLKTLALSDNLFILNISSNWVPPFQAEVISIASCFLGPSFPEWLRSQRNIDYLDFSNASLSGFLPNWFWDISGSLKNLNFSSNQFKGRLPNPVNISDQAFIDLSSNNFDGPIPLPVRRMIILNLSDNKFSGHIPKFIGKDQKLLSYLSLAGNQLSGTIPVSIAKMESITAIDLSRNFLTGNIPEVIGNCLYLEVLDLQNNNLSGSIPSSFGYLSNLQVLHMRNNKFTGELPSSFRDLTNLETLDLGYNRLTGEIPSWIVDSFPTLRILILRSNKFSGKLSSAFLNLSSLQILDLAENELTGKIPASLGNLDGMIRELNSNQYLFYAKTGDLYYEEKVVVTAKSQSLEYSKTLSLVTCIDLSGNNFQGELPHEITKLSSLLVLNLSRNHISGPIPHNISEFHKLLSLDLSSNLLSGPIPESMSSLSSLGYLNLSNNNLSGKVPYKGQLSTFDAPSFDDNPFLCGAPLIENCLDDDKIPEGSSGNENDNHSVDTWFYMTVGLGFAAGILVPFFILTLKSAWSDMYFVFVDKIVTKILCFVW